MHDARVRVFILTPSACSAAPAKTKQVRKLRKVKRSLKIKGGCEKSSTLSWTTAQIQRKLEAYHAEPHVRYRLCGSRAHRAKKCFSFSSAVSLLVGIQLTFKQFGVIKSQCLNNGKEFPLWVLNNGVCCSLSLNGCAHCLALIVRAGSSLWRKQEVDTWRLGLLS